jgi:hypothetical protein
LTAAADFGVDGAAHAPIVASPPQDSSTTAAPVSAALPARFTAL